MKKFLLLTLAIIFSGLMSGAATIRQMENQKRRRSEWLQGKINFLF